MTQPLPSPFAVPRRSRRLLALALVLAVVLAAVALAPKSSQAQLAVGASAPDFTLTDTQGVSRSLFADYSDQVVVLFFVGYG